MSNEDGCPEAVTMRRLISIQFVLATLICVTSCHAAPAQAPSWVSGSVRSADGVLISYQTAGEGPVSLVFVHGWSCDRSYWRGQLEYFAQYHRVVALDLAGHGESGLDREDWTIPGFGHDVVAVMDSLQLERVVLVGHSMGGPVIVEAARIAPQNVIGLVGVDTLQDPDALGMTHEAVEHAAARFENDFAGAMRELVSAVMFVPESDPELKSWIVEDMASAVPEVGIGALRSTLLWPSTNRSEALAALPAPVRLINSALFPTNSAAVERHGMHVVIMSEVGHFLMMEAPESFNALLSSAIEEFTD